MQGGGRQLPALSQPFTGGTEGRGTGQSAALSPDGAERRSERERHPAEGVGEEGSGCKHTWLCAHASAQIEEINEKRWNSSVFNA